MSEAALASSNQIGLPPWSSSAGASGAAQSMSQLMGQYGAQTMRQSVDNLAVDYLGVVIGALIEGSGMPNFMKQDAMAKLDEALGPFRGDAPRGAEQGVDQAMGPGTEAGKSVQEGLMDMVKDRMKEETEQAGSGAGGKDGGGGGTGNWLAVLARALGKTAGEHLKSMVALGEQMGGIDSKANPEKFAEVQAEFQAEAQIFKMFQEAISTMIKNIGEGMAAVARKT